MWKSFQQSAGEPVSGPVFDGLQLDAIQNQSQLKGCQRNDRLCSSSRQFKRSFLQPLMINSQAILIPTDQFHLVAPPVNENEHISAQNVLLHLLFDQSTQSIKGLSHIRSNPVQKIPPVIKKR
jgi:hypothetical protein